MLEQSIEISQASYARTATAASPSRNPSHWTTVQRLSSDEWLAILAAIPGKKGARARCGGTTRKFVEAVLWVAQSGGFWSNLPVCYGSWRSNYVRFTRWAQDGHWNRLFEYIADETLRAELTALVSRYLSGISARTYLRRYAPTQHNAAETGQATDASADVASMLSGPRVQTEFATDAIKITIIAEGIDPGAIERFRTVFTRWVERGAVRLS